MAIYRIRIEKTDVVSDVEAKWLKGGPKAESSDHYAYEMPPPGAMKKDTTQVYDQTVETLDMAKLVQVVNGLI